MITPDTIVKVNKLCVDWFKKECHEQGIDWQVSNTAIASMKFRVIMTIGNRRALISDNQSTMWVSQSVLKAIH